MQHPCAADPQSRSDTYREDDTSTTLHNRTSSPPCRDPGTSSMHAGCRSRRMTSFSSTTPLNSHTHSRPHLPSLLGRTVSWPGLRFTHFDKKKGTHVAIHEHSHENKHPCLSLSSCDLHSVGSGAASHHPTNWLLKPILQGQVSKTTNFAWKGPFHLILPRSPNSSKQQQTFCI